MTVLIKDGQPIARTKLALKSGEQVRAAYSTTPEAIDASREENLVNAFDVKASNAKKWEDEEYVSLPLAMAINDGNSEFAIA